MIVGVGHMFLWSEDVGKRGSNEIWSCLLKYLDAENPQGEFLIIISENFEGKKKNSLLLF